MRRSSHRAHAPIACALALLGGVSCSDPGIDEYEPHTGLITGTIFYPGGTARGNVIVLLYRADALPPPTGTARPENLVVVPSEEIFKDVEPGRVGDFAAPYTIPSVPAGTYQVRAFLDADGDFSPLDDLLAQPTAGDVGGGYVDRDTLQFLPVMVEVDRVSAQVNVLLGREIPVERPAFAITSSASFTVPLARPGSLTIEAHAVRGGLVDMDPARTAFLIQWVDEDGDGNTDDKNGDHLPDVYPRVVLRKLGEAANGSIIVPLIIDPTPYVDALTSSGRALTRRLDLIVPTIAVARRPEGDVVLPEIPPGSYEVVVVSGTGQTWTVPNALAQLQPAAPDPTQSVSVSMTSGRALTVAHMRGTLRVSRGRRADAYVIAFAKEDPPPPAGTGRPVALVSVPKDRFRDVGDALEASFDMPGLADGNYLVRGLLDVDGDFSPLSELRAQPSAKDFVGASVPAVVRIEKGESSEQVSIDLAQPVGFPRPRFELEPTLLSRNRLPGTVDLVMPESGIPVLTSDPVRVPVVLGSGDQDGDNFPDVLPRVLLTRLRDDVADPRLAANDPASIVIPGVVDPLPFIVPLAAGAPVVAARALRVIVPPVAFRLEPGGARTPLSPPPAGRYRVNVLSPTGQTWSVPSDLDFVLGRVGTPLEDPRGASFVEISDEPTPRGRIEGAITLSTEVPAGDFQVVVLAFEAEHPPPPLGAGRPVAVAVVPKSAFAGSTSAPYALGGLTTGLYTVRAFLDADDDFTAWFDTLNQPDAGDVGGGHLAQPHGLLEVAVNALGGATTGVGVAIVDALRYRTDRPAFVVEPALPTLVLSERRTLTATLTAFVEASDVLRQTGVFPVQWVDLDGDNQADDKDLDGAPDVYPRVVAELLDPSDPSGRTLAVPVVRIPGLVDPAQFASLGFPVDMTTDVRTTVDARQLSVKFPPVAIDGEGRPISPPAGRYRITLVNAAGQTWSVPNELARATGTDLVETQGRALVVRD